jgi:folate/biopterin transporter
MEEYLRHTYNYTKMKLSTIDVNYLVIVLVALSQGITGLSDLAISYLYKDDLKLEPAEVSRINSLATLPWIVKPIYGLISDSFPIFNFRRKPYLFIFGLISIVCWVLMAEWVDNVNKVVMIIMINQVSIAFCNVIGEALVVETSQKQRDLDPDAGAKNVSMYFMIKSFGSLLTAFSSGALLEYMDKRKIFLITACFPCTIVISSLLLREKKVNSEDNCNENQDFGHEPEEIQIFYQNNRTPSDNDRNNNSDNYETINISTRTISSETEIINKSNNKPPKFKEQINLFYSFLLQDKIYKPVIFIFLFMVTPSYGDPLFYFYTNVLNFSPIVMGRLKLIYGIASVSGIFLYNRILKNVGFKTIVFSTTILYIFFNLLTIMVVMRINQMFGIPDFWFCMTADALTTALGEINTMPLLVLACNICPKNIEGTLYAFLMSVVNLGSLFSNQLGAALTSSLGITNNRFENLPTLILIVNIVLILPMPGLYLINERDYSNKSCENISDDSHTVTKTVVTKAILIDHSDEEKKTILHKRKSQADEHGDVAFHGEVPMEMEEKKIEYKY